MTAFYYRAVSPSGVIRKGTMNAQSKGELISFLKESGLELIEAKLTNNNKRRFKISASTRRIKMEDKIALCRHLQDLLNAGLPFAQAMDCVIEATANAPLRDHLIMINNDIKSGNLIAVAFAKRHVLFDAMAVSIISSGEQSGHIDQAFGRLHKQLVWQNDLQRTITKALRYPLFLLIVASSVVTFMMALVIPQIINFLTSLELALPFSTRLLIKGAEVFATAWWALPTFILIFLAMILAGRAISTRFTTAMDAWLLKTPVLGCFLNKVIMARFLTSLSILLESGHTAPKALELSISGINNTFMNMLGRNAYDQLLKGQSLSNALSPLLSQFGKQIIIVGENSGHITKAIADVAQRLEREAQDSISRALALLEPTLTILVGGLLVWVVLAVMGPVYGSLTSLSQGM